MRIVLVYPYIKENYRGCNPPVSLLYLAAGLARSNYEVNVFDGDFGKLSYSTMANKIYDFKPDLIGIPLFSDMLPHAYEFISTLYHGGKKGTIFVGGPHVTALPVKTLEEFAMVEFALKGEADLSIIDFVREFEGKRNFASVKGLAYRDKGKIYNNADADVIKDLDFLPLPARNLLAEAYKNLTYWRIGHTGVTDIIISSRGCPFKCNFCFKVSEVFRLRSPENVLGELQEIRSMGTRSVHIMDDLFVSNKTRCLKILDMIGKEKLNMEFKVRARVDNIDEETLYALKRAGVKAVVYGIESGSQKMLDLMNKRTTVEQNRRAIELTKKAGLQCYADMFIGYLGETPDTIKETERFILQTKPTAVHIAVMYPLPKTKVHDEAKEKGVLMDEYSIRSSRAWIKLPWINSKKELEKIAARITKKYLWRVEVFYNSLKVLFFNLDFRQIKILTTYVIKKFFEIG